MAASIITFLGFVSLSNPLSLPVTSTRVPGIVQLPVAQHTNNATLSETIESLSKRQASDILTNTQTGTLYLISLTIGTPPQSVSVQIDTGSSDLWVDPTCANAGGSTSIALCNSYPVYEPNKSSTAEDANEAMTLQYGKGECDGEYYTDTVSFGGVTLIQQQFGVVSSSSDLSVGILGISWGIDLGTDYYNVVDQLALQGYTASRAFSLDLGNVDTAQGSIIFGGIDTKKYYGALEKRPIIPYWEAPDGAPRYWIYMSSVGITVPGSSSSKLYTASNYTQPVFLDSGGTLSRLPTSVVNAIVADFPGTSYYGGLYFVPCSYTSMAGTVDFGFGNTVIKVPYHQFIWTAGSNACVLGVVPTPNDVEWVLGDTFLRAAFVVYDQDNENLLLANAANCGTNLVAIGRGSDAVPSITGACATPTSSTSSSSSKKTSTSSSSKTTATSSSFTTSTSSNKFSSTSISTSKTSSISSTSSSAPTTSRSSSSSSTAIQPSISSTSSLNSLSSTSSSTLSSSLPSSLLSAGLSSSKPSSTSSFSSSKSSSTNGIITISTLASTSPSSSTSSSNVLSTMSSSSSTSSSTTAKKSSSGGSSSTIFSTTSTSSSKLSSTSSINTSSITTKSMTSTSLSSSKSTSSSSLSLSKSVTSTTGSSSSSKFSTISTSSSQKASFTTSSKVSNTFSSVKQTPSPSTTTLAPPPAFAALSGKSITSSKPSSSSKSSSVATSTTRRTTSSTSTTKRTTSSTKTTTSTSSKRTSTSSSSSSSSSKTTSATMPTRKAQRHEQHRRHRRYVV